MKRWKATPAVNITSVYLREQVAGCVYTKLQLQDNDVGAQAPTLIQSAAS